MLNRNRPKFIRHGDVNISNNLDIERLLAMSIHALVAQWSEHLTGNRVVPRSNPGRCKGVFVDNLTSQ